MRTQHSVYDLPLPNATTFVSYTYPVVDTKQVVHCRSARRCEHARIQHPPKGFPDFYIVAGVAHCSLVHSALSIRSAALCRAVIGAASRVTPRIGIGYVISPAHKRTPIILCPISLPVVRGSRCSSTDVAALPTLLYR